MPNWASGTIHAGVPTKNVPTFLSYFIGSNEYEENTKQENQEYFYRTFYESHCINNEENGLTDLTVFFDCAWSCEGCLGYGKNVFMEDEIPCPILSDVCKNLDIEYLNGDSEEPGIGFGEEFYFDKEDGEILWNVFDITNYYCKDCEMYFSSREEDEAECPSCGQYIRSDSIKDEECEEE